MARLLIILGCCLLPVSALLGQVQPQGQLDRFERQLEQIQRQSRIVVDPTIPPTDRVLADYGAYLSISYLSLDDPTRNNHGLRQYEMVAYGRLNFDDAHEFFARIHTLYNDFNHGDSFNGRDDYPTPRVERAYYKFDLKRSLAAYEGKTIDGDLVFTGGRQFVNWGNGLTLSDVVDGGTIAAAYGPFTLDLLAGVTANFVTDFDSSRPNFRNDTVRGLYGAMLGVRLGKQRLFAYGLSQRDYNADRRLVVNDIKTRFDYNSYYLAAGASGNLGDNLLYSAEGVYEGGNTLSNSFDASSSTQVTQTTDPIEAYAFDGRLDYVLADARRTRFSAELILATGDTDRISTNTTLGGNLSGTRDHAFNAFGLLNTGLAFAPAVSNIVVMRVGGSTYPLPSAGSLSQLQIGGDLLVFDKLVRDAPIDETTSNQRYLGSEGDVYLNWPITSDVTLAIRYGLFFPGSAIKGDRSPRNFFFTGVTYAF